MSEDQANIKPKSKRGGFRAGAGRPKGSRNKATLLEKRTIVDLAKDHAPAALAALVRVMTAPNAPLPAVVAAANSLLDRGYGRPVQSLEHTGKDGGPIATLDASMLSPVEREQRLLAIQQALTLVATPTVAGNGQTNGHGGNGHG